MTRVHFAGLNTSPIAALLEGHPVLVSYADIIRRPGVWAREILPRLEAGKYPAPILDSGAFTELRDPTFHVDIVEYSEFVLQYGSLFDQIITLDDIGGDLTRTWNNTAYLLDDVAGIDGIGTVIPVFHGREPFEVLEHYCQRFDRVALGFARDMGRISKDQGNGLGEDAWLTRALDICASAGVTVHGLGMTSYALKRGHDRLDTTDSTTWINEKCALSADSKAHGTRGIARRLIDGLTKHQHGQLAIRSYTAIGNGQAPSELIDASWGQARTVFRRYSQLELVSVLGDILVEA